MGDGSRLIAALRAALAALRQEKFDRHHRHVGVGDLLFDRWQTARFYGFGEGTSCYNNVLVIGDVVVGRNTFIGPNVVLDGSGGLVIGDHVSVSAGVQIYSHHTVARATSLGAAPIARAATRIGNGVYIGPNAVIQKGVQIGDRAVIGALSLVNRDVAAERRVFGAPALPVDGDGDSNDAVPDS